MQRDMKAQCTIQYRKERSCKVRHNHEGDWSWMIYILKISFGRSGLVKTEHANNAMQQTDNTINDTKLKNNTVTDTQTPTQRYAPHTSSTYWHKHIIHTPTQSVSLYQILRKVSSAFNCNSSFLWERESAKGLLNVCESCSSVFSCHTPDNTSRLQSRLCSNFLQDRAKKCLYLFTKRKTLVSLVKCAKRCTFLITICFQNCNTHMHSAWCMIFSSFCCI